MVNSALVLAVSMLFLYILAVFGFVAGLGLSGSPWYVHAAIMGGILWLLTRK